MRTVRSIGMYGYIMACMYTVITILNYFIYSNNSTFCIRTYIVIKAVPTAMLKLVQKFLYWEYTRVQCIQKASLMRVNVCTWMCVFVCASVLVREQFQEQTGGGGGLKEDLRQGVGSMIRRQQLRATSPTDKMQNWEFMFGDDVWRFICRSRKVTGVIKGMNGRGFPIP